MILTPVGTLHTGMFLQSGGPILWNLCKQTTVAFSTTKAEYMSWRFWLLYRKPFGGEVFEKKYPELQNRYPSTMYCVNQSAIHLAGKDIRYSSRSKHIDIRQAAHPKKHNHLKHVSAEHQAADLVIKALTIKNFGRKSFGTFSIRIQDLQKFRQDFLLEHLQKYLLNPSRMCSGFEKFFPPEVFHGKLAVFFQRFFRYRSQSPSQSLSRSSSCVLPI